MSDGSFTIEALLDDKQFKDGLKKVTDASADAAEKSSKSMFSIGGALKSVAIGATAITAGIAGAFKAVSHFVEEYQKQVATEKQLLALMQNRTDYSRKMYISHLAFSREMMQNTSFDDSEILKSIQQFQTFGNISQDTMQKATRAAADIASTTGQSIVSVSIQLGKALSEPLKMASALKRSGVLFDENKLKSLGTLAEQQAFLLKEIESQYAGSAVGAADKFKQFKNIMGDVKEEIGQALMPVFVTLGKVILGLITPISSVIKWLTNLMSSTTDIKGAVQELEIQSATLNKTMAETSEVDKLADRYDALTKQTKLTAKEQAELTDITAQLAKAVPGAITAVDQYGKALGIATSEVRNFNKEQRQLAQDVMESALDKTLNDAKKALKNFDEMRLTQKMKRGETLTGEEASQAMKNRLTRIGNFDFTGKMDTSEMNEAAKQMQELSKQYDVLFTNSLRHRNLTEEQTKTMYQLALQTGRTKDSFEQYSRQLQETAIVQNGLINQFGTEYTQLNAARQKIMRDIQQSEATQAEIQATYQKLRAEQNKEDNRRNTPTISGTGNKDLEKLREYAKKLNEINMTDLAIKLDVDFDAFEKTLKDRFKVIFGEENSKKLFKDFNTSLMAGTITSSGEWEAMVDNISRAYNITSEESEKILRDFIAKRNTIIKDTLKETDKAMKDFTGYFETYEGKIEKINNDRIEIEEKLKNIREQIGEEEYQQRLKLIKDATKIAKQKIAGETITEVVEGLNKGLSGLTGMIKGMKTGANIGQMGASMSGVTDMFGKFGFKQAPVIGGIMAGATQFIQGMMDTFSGDDKAKKQRLDELKRQEMLVEATKARYALELNQERELIRQIEYRMKLISSLQNLYFDDTAKGLEKTIEIIKQNLSDLDLKIEAEYGFDISSMTKEQIEEALRRAQTESEKWVTSETLISQMQSQYAKLKSVVLPSQEVGFFGTIGALTGQRQQIIDEYLVPIKKMADSVGLGHLFDIQNFKGYAGLDAMMQDFITQLTQQKNISDTQLEYINSYINSTEELYNIEVQQTEEKQKQLGLQMKLSDELMKQLRALKDSRTNALLDQMQEIEYKISTGQIGKNEGDKMIAALMNQIMNQMSGLGETGLLQGITLARAEMYQGMNESQYNALAGKGEVVQFHTGGLVTDTGLAELQKGEYVLSNPQVSYLAGLAQAIKQGVMTSQNIVNMANQISITVKDNSDVLLVENAIYKVFDDIESRTGRKVLV